MRGLGSLRELDDSAEWVRFELDETWLRLGSIAFRMARRITRSKEDAQDVAQATLAAYEIPSRDLPRPRDCYAA
jgi:DNA-directed RNA polymerase specialized sigma24 family protein